MSQYYKKYMKKIEEEKPSYLKLFIGAFLLMVVFFVIVATHLTSSVDTTIGENDEGDRKESGIGVKHLIDSRLRFIQMEDASGPKKEETKPETIEQYEKEIQEVQTEGYKGDLENSYGYNKTEQSQPYSPTYNNAKTQYDNVQSPTTKNNSNTTNSPVSAATVNKTFNAPTPSTQHRTAAPIPAPIKTTSPAHNIQKNLTPTGMN